MISKKSEELIKTVRVLWKDEELKIIINQSKSKSMEEGVFRLSDVGKDCCRIKDKTQTALYENLNQRSDQELNVLLAIYYFGSTYGDSGQYLDRDIYEVLEDLIPDWPNWGKKRVIETLMGKSCLEECLERGFKGLGFEYYFREEKFYGREV